MNLLTALDQDVETCSDESPARGKTGWMGVAGPLKSGDRRRNGHWFAMRQSGQSHTAKELLT